MICRIVRIQPELSHFAIDKQIVLVDIQQQCPLLSIVAPFNLEVLDGRIDVRRGMQDQDLVDIFIGILFECIIDIERKRIRRDI